MAITKSMKYIFLDFDGVMNTPATLHNGKIGALDHEFVARFNDVVRKTGAKVVISSTWRLFKNIAEVILAAGFLIDEFEGMTPSLFDPANPEKKFCRGDEIAKWMQESGVEIDRYAILDDDEDMLPEQQSHFFKTETAHGLTQDIADRLIQYLNKP